MFEKRDMKSCKLTTLLMVIAGLFYGCETATQKPDNQARLLSSFLFQKYNKNVRPVLDVENVTSVSVQLMLLNIIEFSEVNERLILTGKLYMSWKDEYLCWDPSEFGGVKDINVPQDDIWKPDIALENSIESYKGMGTAAMNVRVERDGTVLWKPLQVFQSTCATDVSNFPLDTQTCSLNFEAWTHSTKNIQVHNAMDTIKMHGFNGHPEWSIIDTQAITLHQRDDMYVVFSMKLKRKWQYVMLNVILPIFLLSLLSMIVFLLPAECGEKASFSITVFLSLCVFLTIVSQQLPRTSENVSVFNVYVFVQVMLSTFITITTAIQLRLHGHRCTSPVPAWMKSIVTRFRCLGRQQQPKVGQSDQPHDQEPSHLEKDADKPEVTQNLDVAAKEVTWQDIADLLNPVSLAFFMFINVSFTLSLLAFAVVNQQQEKPAQ